jgi:hypothetical protein
MILRASVRRYGLSAVAALLSACGGDVVRLGDGPVGVTVTGGGAGMSGSAGMTGGGGSPSAGAEGPAAGDAGMGGGMETCASGHVLASEVVWIGDSWVTLPGMQHTRVTELARQAGKLGAGEDYSFELAKGGEDMAAVAKQYETRQGGAVKIKVLLMDGGTWNPLIASLTGASVPAAIDTAIRDFRGLLGKIASDGTVEHIVYFLQPELPKIPGVAAMRPQLQQACEESLAPCHFLDLEPLWEQRRDDEPSYTADDGIQASPKGGTVIGEAIWKIMQDECIAQ